ncbi:hypothetical protein AAC387_Pa06g3235 [Persea americana]
MKAVTSPGGPEVLQVQEVSRRRRGPDTDRGDSFKPGRYVTEKGIVSAAGGREPVCTLLSGGGYAEKVAVPAGQVLPVPRGSQDKLTFCKELGADVCINYKTEDFVARVKEETGGKGVDVIMDNVGGPYFQRNLNSLNVNSRLFIIGFQGGTITEANLGCMLARRLTVQALNCDFVYTTAGLRTRSPENEALIVSEVEKNVWPAIAAGKVKPMVYRSFPLYEAAEAHRLMESSKHIGKILLIP